MLMQTQDISVKPPVHSPNKTSYSTSPSLVSVPRTSHRARALLHSILCGAVLPITLPADFLRVRQVEGRGCS